MMAFERTPSPPALEPATLETLRVVLGQAVSRGNHAGELHEVLCQAAAEARAKGIHAEKLLIILKDVWQSLPGLNSSAHAETEAGLLQELISRCIREYYRG